MFCAEPGTQYDRPAAPVFFSTTHRDNGTRLWWVREVSPAIIIIKRRDNDNAMEPGPGQGITGDNATETFALILAASVLFTTMLCHAIYTNILNGTNITINHAQPLFLQTITSCTRIFTYLHTMDRKGASSKIVLAFWHLSFEQCVRFPIPVGAMI